MVSLLVRPEKKIRVYDAQMCKNANPGCHLAIFVFAPEAKMLVLCT